MFAISAHGRKLASEAELRARTRPVHAVWLTAPPLEAACENGEKKVRRTSPASPASPALRLYPLTYRPLSTPYGRQRVARSCIFCSGTPTTNAHIFRKAWLEQLMPHPEPYVHRHVREGKGGKGEMRIWKKRESDLKVNCACSACNGGWMDRLDKAAERLFLDAAVRGEACRLDHPAEQEELARWCTLVAVLTSQTQRTPTVENLTAQVVRQGNVPEGLQIWTFRTEPKGTGNIYWSVGKEWRGLPGGASDANAYFVTFGIEHFVAQVFVPTVRTPKGIKFERGRNAAILSQLWPLSGRPFLWPPKTIPWDRNLTNLINAFTPS
jgi:hypothetical protein